MPAKLFLPREHMPRAASGAATLALPRHSVALPSKGLGLRAGNGLIPQPPKAATAPIQWLDDLPFKKHQRPVCVFWKGRRGTGKTTGMTWTAMSMKYLYGLLGIKRRVLSNIWMDFADGYTPFLLDYLLDNPEYAKDSIICVDEVASAFPSKRAMARVNVEFANFLIQIRKIQAEVIFTTQFPSMVEHDLLMQVDYFVSCDYLDMAHPLGAIELSIWDWWGQVTGKDYRKPWPPESGTQDWNKRIVGVKNVFGHFESNERVAPLYAKNRLKQIESMYGVMEQPGEEPQDKKMTGDIHAFHGSPSTLIEYLDQYHDVFSVNGVLDAAKYFHKDEIKSVRDLVAFLKDNGFVVEPGRDPNAFRPEWVSQQVEVAP